MSPKDERLLALLKKESSKNRLIEMSSTEKKAATSMKSASTYSTIGSNNYMNIRPSRKTTWLGQAGELGGFVVFEKPEYSVRAFYKIMNSYANQGADTLSKIINKYAPASDNNNPSKYIDFVIKKLKEMGLTITKDQKLNPSVYPYLAKAFMQMESGLERELSWFKQIYNNYM